MIPCSSSSTKSLDLVLSNAAYSLQRTIRRQKSFHRFVNKKVMICFYNEILNGFVFHIYRKKTYRIGSDILSKCVALISLYFVVWFDVHMKYSSPNWDCFKLSLITEHHLDGLRISLSTSFRYSISSWTIIVIWAEYADGNWLIQLVLIILFSKTDCSCSQVQTQIIRPSFRFYCHFSFSLKWDEVTERTGITTVERCLFIPWVCINIPLTNWTEVGTVAIGQFNHPIFCCSFTRNVLPRCSLHWLVKWIASFCCSILILGSCNTWIMMSGIHSWVPDCLNWRIFSWSKSILKYIKQGAAFWNI